MRSTILLVFCLGITIANATLRGSEFSDVNEVSGGKLWVLLTAGSNGYENYRHQADVCHAYHVVRGHGVPEENIITMMFDDIAFSKENPEPGKIYNAPNGPDVYHGVKIDYKGLDVSPENFLAVLAGNQTSGGNGRVFKSGPDDYLFVYFSDHGARGILGFPSPGYPKPVPFLHAEDLIQTLKTMHEKRKFKKMVIYVEACESGSMFKGLLPDNVDIFATTAANGTTSSYACYYDDELKTFLGDVYSVKWLEDSDHENLNVETIEKQYEIVKEETNTSQVCQFGDLSIGQMKVADFQGPKRRSVTFSEGRRVQRRPDIPPEWYHCGRDAAVPSLEVPKVILERRIAYPRNGEDQREAKEQLKALLTRRSFMTETTLKIIAQVTEFNPDLMDNVYAIQQELTNFSCYREVANRYHDQCFSLTCNDYAMKMVNYFANMCEKGFDKDAILRAIDNVCVHEPVCGIL